MKSFLFTVVILTSLLTFAEAKDDGRAADFTKHKQEILSSLDERIVILQQQKTCINAAKDNDDFKKCNESIRTKEKALREKEKVMRQKNIDEQIKHLQQEKEKMSSEK